MRNLSYGARPLYTYSDLFVISDVHGELDKLKSLIAKLPLNPQSTIVFVGDVIDQGRDGVGVLLFIQQLKRQYKVYLIEGNHERIFKRIIEGTFAMQGALDPGFLEEFLYYGANSVTVEQINKIVKGYRLDDVLNSTIPYFETSDLIITHAPIENKVWKNLNFDEWQNDDYLDNNNPITAYPLDHLYRIEALLWTFINDESEEVKNLNKFLVCGHQNHYSKYDAPRIFPHRAFLDCGAGYSASKAVFAMHFPSKTIYSSN
jgi:predicted MPP superfamily phosphohydrolase